MGLPDRHEIDQGDSAIRGLENRVQHHRVVAVGAADPWLRIGGTDTPSSMLERTEQSGKTRVAVEARQAQPVDGPVAANERGRPAIADQGIVLDRERRFRSPRQAHGLIRPHGDARVCPLHVRLDGSSRGAGGDDRLIRGALPVEFTQDIRNDLLDRGTHVDMDRAFVGLRLLQDIQLAVEKAGRPEWLFARGQTRCKQRPIPAQIDDAHLRSPVGQEVAIAAPERRASDYARRATPPPCIDQSRDLLEPRPLVALIGEMTRLQLGSCCPIEFVTFLEWPVEALGEGGRERRLAAAREAHQNEDQPNAGVLGPLDLHRDLIWRDARRAGRERRKVRWFWGSGRAAFDHRRSGPLYWLMRRSRNHPRPTYSGTRLSSEMQSDRKSSGQLDRVSVT